MKARRSETLGFFAISAIILSVSLLTFVHCRLSNTINYNEVYDLSTSEKYRLQKEKSAAQNLQSGKLINGWYQTSDESKIQRQYSQSSQMFHLDPEPLIFMQNCLRLQELETEEKGLIIQMSMDNRGAKEWYSATKNNIGKYLILVVDNQIIAVTLIEVINASGVATLKSEHLDNKQINKLNSVLKTQD